MGQTRGMTTTEVENESREIPPFPWPRFVTALPITWGLLLALLLANPGDEYGELALGAIAAWPFVHLFMFLGQTAAVVLGLLAATTAFVGAGALLDRMQASPRVFLTVWSCSTLALIVIAGFRHRQFARHLREGGSAIASVPLAAAAIGLTVTAFVVLALAGARRLRRDRRQFDAWHRRFRGRDARPS